MVVDFIFMIAEQCLKPTEDINELKKRPERKITKLVLDLFKKCEDYAWVKLSELNLKRSKATGSAQVSYCHNTWLPTGSDQKINFEVNLASAGAAPYIATLFYFQEKYPEYKWNPSHPLGVISLPGFFGRNTEYLREDFNEVRNK